MNKENIFNSNQFTPTPSPKDLGLSCSEYRIREYKQLLKAISNKYQSNFEIALLSLFIFIWFLGLGIGNDIFRGGFFFRYILGNSIALLWSWSLFKLHNESSEILYNLFIERKFNSLNNKLPLSENIHFDIHYLPFSIRKFRKEELTQIKEYISFTNQYESTISVAKRIKKQMQEKTK